MAIFDISLSQLYTFFLIFLRVGAIMLVVPIFDSKNIPLMFKAGLSFSISIVLFPILKSDIHPVFAGIIPFGIGVAGEIIMGLIIGFSVRLIFAGVQLAGQIAGFQMGFAIANVIDPLSNAQVSIIAQLKNLVAMLIFLAINAHHWFLRALVESFRLVPPFDFQFSNSLMAQLVKLSCNMFIIAIQVGAPVMAALLLTSAALGLIARTVPQMHIFIVAMPLKIMVGLLFLALSLPFLSAFLRQIFNGWGRDLFLLLRAM